MRSLPLLLAACAAPEVLPVQAPTPVVLSIEASGFQAGFPGTVIVEGASARARVGLAASPVGPGAGVCPPPLSGGCLDIVSPELLGIVRADPDGRAVFAFQLPPNLFGPVWLQAAELGGVAATTPVQPALVLAPGTDTDGDGLLDAEEWALGTDPDEADIDLDGLVDGDEVAAGTDPFLFDTDDDGLGDGAEVALGTDPLSADTDGDGLLDGVEDTLGTDPTEVDSDGDEALDGVELERGLDPMSDDSDGDGILDGLDVFPLTPNAPDPFVVDDVVVSDPTGSLPDPEFHDGSQQLVWQTVDGAEVWVADIEPNTGAIVPTDGRGTLLASDVAPMSVSRNGPEWLDSDLGASVLFVLDGPSGWELGGARPAQGGGWTDVVIAGDASGFGPFGSLDPGDPNPRIVYSDLTIDEGTAVRNRWREVDDPSVGGALPEIFQSARWVPGRREVLGFEMAFTEQRLLSYDVDTEVLTELPAGGVFRSNPVGWTAPETGGQAVAYLRGPGTEGGIEIAVIAEGPGGWSEWTVIRGPAAYPWVISPEVFVYQGVSYVSFLASKEPKAFDNGEALVYVAAVDPSAAFVRRVSDDASLVRKDPEPYLGGARPMIFYADRSTASRVIHRCEIGL